MSYTLLDSHCHITCDALYERIEEVMSHVKEANITSLLVVCTNFVEYERAKALQNQYDGIQIAMGFHPNDLFHFQEEDYVRLEKLVKDKEIAALGEIGLDYHWDDVPKEVQKEGLIRQIQIANTYHMPIIIHMREATEDTLTILKQYAKTTFLMHCFSGSKEIAKEVMRLGGYLSFAGPLTFRNARGLLEVPEVCDLDKILIETDCPYLTPHPHRGKENEPMYVSYTFEKLCELLHIEKEQLAKQIEKNYYAFLGKA